MYLVYTVSVGRAWLSGQITAESKELNYPVHMLFAFQPACLLVFIKYTFDFRGELSIVEDHF